MNNKFNDYPSDQIQAKLKQVVEFEAKYGESSRTKSWKKWCTDAKYRQNEWKFRQGIANYALNNAHKAFQTNDKSTF
jgi:hypothetical protein